MVATLAVPVFVVVALVGTVAAGPVVGLLAGLLLAGALAAYVLRSGPAAALGALGGRPADPVVHARLHNLVDGLCSGAGVPKPQVLVVDDPAPNAAVLGLEPRQATLVVTSSLLERLRRVELEGVLARELAAIKSHDVVPATVAVAALRVAGWFPPAAARIRALASATPADAVDASGVAITRYPPGLAAALAAIEPDAGAVRAGSPATAHLWLVPPTPTPQPLEERIDALREL